MKMLSVVALFLALMVPPALADDYLINNHPNGSPGRGGAGPYVSVGNQLHGYQIMFTPTPTTQEFMARYEAQGWEYIGSDEAFWSYNAWRRPVPKDEAEYQEKFKANEFAPLARSDHDAPSGQGVTRAD